MSFSPSADGPLAASQSSITRCGQAAQPASKSRCRSGATSRYGKSSCGRSIAWSTCGRGQRPRTERIERRGRHATTTPGSRLPRRCYTACLPRKSSMPNRLARETSPYLQQHANNPVDWYAWGEQALKLAREQDKPILLSVGYSACHWCHVMAHESFEDPGVAALMNELFINIKVDREERPDLDQIYQAAHAMLTQRPD